MDTIVFEERAGAELLENQHGGMEALAGPSAAGGRLHVLKDQKCAGLAPHAGPAWWVGSWLCFA